MKTRIIRTVMRTIGILRDPYYQGAAAEIGFYFIFSIIPILALMLQALNLFDVTDELFASMTARFAENEMYMSIIDAVQGSMNSKWSLAFLAAALWSASKIEFSMIRMADYTYNPDNAYNVNKVSKVKSYIKTRLRAIFTVAALIFVIVMLLLVLVFGRMLINLLNMLMSEFLGLVISTDVIFFVLSWPAAWAVCCIFMCINYKMLPAKKISLRKTLPGSIFASAGMMAVTGGYSIYLEYFSNFNVVYGSLGAIIALLLWFYLLSYIMLLGMVINVSWFDEEERN